MADITKLDHLNLDLDKDGKKEQYNLTDYRLGTEDVADVSETEAEFHYLYTITHYPQPSETAMGSEKSKVGDFFGWVKGAILEMQSKLNVAFENSKTIIRYYFATSDEDKFGQKVNGSIRVTTTTNGLEKSEDIQISNYGDTDISDIGDGTLTGAIKAASENGGGLRIVPINQEAYAELPQDQQDRDDIIWDVYDEDYEVTAKNIFFDWSGTTLTKDNVEDVIKEIDSTVNETKSSRQVFTDVVTDTSKYYGYLETRDGDNLYRLQNDVDGILRYWKSVDNGVSWQATDIVLNTQSIQNAITRTTPTSGTFDLVDNDYLFVRSGTWYKLGNIVFVNAQFQVKKVLPNGSLELHLSGLPLSASDGFGIMSAAQYNIPFTINSGVISYKNDKGDWGGVGWTPGIYGIYRASI